MRCEVSQLLVPHGALYSNDFQASPCLVDSSSKCNFDARRIALTLWVDVVYQKPLHFQVESTFLQFEEVL